MTATASAAAVPEPAAPTRAGNGVDGAAAGRTRRIGAPSASALLARARAEYDRPGSALPALARRERCRGFAGGARWMATAVGQLRGRAVDVPADVSFHRLGLVKYALASAAAAFAVAAAVITGLPLVAVPAAALAFYAAEVQMVFLFPAALDGGRRPFRDARRWLARAGGTLRALPVVMRLAAHMLFGGLFGHGALRAWCTGCLAVYVWYEDLRAGGPLAATGLRSRPRLEIGGTGDLLTRVERVCVRGAAADESSRPTAQVTLLYASDLHLGRPWTRRVADEVLAAARLTSPDVIVLGGDLVDCGRGLPELVRTVRALGGVAPVYAVPGNHDERVGVGRVREAVCGAGGHWLAGAGDGPGGAGGVLLLPTGVWLSGTAVEEPPAGAAVRVLCGHDPAVFASPAALKFDLVLAGHLHGGQCVLAQRCGRLYPGALLNRWTGLRFDRCPGGGGDGNDGVDGPTMLVSRGAADTLAVRWNCPREVVLCHIEYGGRRRA